MGGGETMCIYFTAIGHLKAIDSKISLHLPNTEHLFLSKFCYWTKFFVFLPPMILCICRGCVKKQNNFQHNLNQGLVKGEKFCFRYLDFYF